MAESKATDVYIVDGARTPFLKMAYQPNHFSALELGVITAKSLLLRNKLEANQLDEVIVGCVIPSAEEANIARLLALRAGCPTRTPAWTVQRNCASGLQAIDAARQSILLGQSNVILAGGCEAMSRAPICWSMELIQWIAQWRKQTSWKQRLKLLAKFRWRFITQSVVTLAVGLNDPLVQMSMGQTAENIAFEFNISRQAMDEYALQSQHRTIFAQDQGYFIDELIPLYHDGHCIQQDEGVRRDSSLERLSKLNPVFDKKFGEVTAGNSSQISDGAALVLLANQQAVKDLNLSVLGKIVDVVWVGLEPERMGLGPAFAIYELLKRNHLALTDIDYFEINEAFAGQVLACVQALQDPTFCKNELGARGPVGQINMDHLNVEGGAISIGHPVAASGARLVLHACKLLKRKQARYAIASLCIGGGQGGAILLERAVKEL